MIDEIENSEIIEVEITNYIRDEFGLTEQQISDLTIQKKMYLISIKSEDKWSEFKTQLREVGYII